jgi:CrcB protein
MIQHVGLVALGGAVGSVVRFLVSSLLNPSPGEGVFPYGTFAVNIVGALLAGILAGYSARIGGCSPEVRALLFSGVLGGLTTFSAFGVETVVMIKDGNHFSAALYVTLSLIVGMLVAFTGFTWSAAG